LSHNAAAAILRRARGGLARYSGQGRHVVDIFDEVDEELRAERAKRLLQRYGGLIIAACVASVGAVAGWQGWQYWLARQDVAAAEAYLASLARLDASATPTEEQRKAALPGFEALAQSAPDGYRTLARLQAAALKADSGDLSGAQALWDQVAGDAATDPLLRDLASLIWATRLIDHGDPQLIEARLRPLAVPGNAWRSLAQEQLALLALRQDKPDTAREGFRKLAEDVTAPAGVRARARVVLERLGG
jgi:hypothetical protein